MKPFNFPKADWHKWALAGTLVASLGASMSFNPESKYVARNEYKTKGYLALASCTSPEDKAKPECTQDKGAVVDGDKDKKPAPVASKQITIPIDEFTQAVGVYDVADGKVMYSIEKRAGAASDGADYCLKCAVEAPIKSLDMKNSGLTDELAIQMFIKADAQRQISKLDKASDDDSRPNSSANTFSYAIKCTGFGTGRNTDFEGLLNCQHDGLDKAINACKDKADKDQEKRDSKRSSSRYNSYADDNSQYRVCERFAVNYARGKMLPVIKAALAHPDFHDAGIDAIQNLTGSEGLLDGMSGESQLESELARSLVTADAKVTLAEIQSRDFQDDAKARCYQSAAYAGVNSSICMQNLMSVAGWNTYSQTVMGDRRDLSLNGFDPASMQIFTTGSYLVAPPAGVNFSQVLANIANGSPVSGEMQTVDASGRPLNGRWAQGAPNFPGAPVVNNPINQINGQPQVMNINRPGTVPQNVPSNGFPQMSGAGNGQAPLIK